MPWHQLQVDDKILQFASFMTHMRKDYRLGGLIGISMLLKNSDVGDEITRVITEEVFGCLQDFEH